jgi:hypothetical protein
VRELRDELTPPEMRTIGREGNVSPTGKMSAGEQAFADAQVLDNELLAMHRGGAASSLANVPFVRAFVDRTVATTEREAFISKDNVVSVEGVRRVEAALVAKAYDAPDVVAGLFEVTEPSSRAILGALADNAALAARVKAEIAAGRIATELDPSPALIEAFRLVERARKSGQKVDVLAGQVDLELGAVPPATLDALDYYFRDPPKSKAAKEAGVAYRIAAGRVAIAPQIDRAMNTALSKADAAGDLFGLKPDAGFALREGGTAEMPPGDLTAGEDLAAPATEARDFRAEVRALTAQLDTVKKQRQALVEAVSDVADGDTATFERLSDEADKAKQEIEALTNKIADTQGEEIAARAGAAPAEAAAEPVLALEQPIVRVADLAGGSQGAEFATLKRSLQDGQPFDTIDELMARAPAHQGELVDALYAIAKDLHGAVVDVPPGPDRGVKERETVEGKMIRKKYDTPRRMADVVRAGVIVKKPVEGDRVLAGLVAHDIKVVDEGWLKIDTGYFDRKVMLIFPDGMLGELQLHEATFAHSKHEGGHDLYKLWRDHPKEDVAGIKALEDQMRAHYAPVEAALAAASPEWAAALGGGPHLASSAEKTLAGAAIGTPEPSPRTSRPSTEAQPVEGLSTQAVTPSGATAASRASQLNQERASGAITQDIGAPAAARKPLGDPQLAAEADSVIADVGEDFQIKLAEPGSDEVRTVSIAQARAEAAEVDAAAEELLACIAGAAGVTAATGGAAAVAAAP